MPIGVPKVPFRLPGEPNPQWIDLYQRLYRERLLFLCQDLQDELTNQLIGIMLYLNAEEEEKGLFLYINSLGGSVSCGIAIYDTMNYVTSEVTTICVGTAASMASFILAGGERGKRIALPHSRMMIHQPEGGSQGQSTEVIAESEEVMRMRRQIGKIYAERTGQPLRRIARDLDRDQFLSAKEAKEYGLIDQVTVDTKWESKSILDKFLL
uniref:ATP-dependent Clp protease proteolytic subunit n=1 Tax=Koliella corcontica TaxID=155904 RepID=A0A097KMS6_9CHLO|nr:proteolytic subunit 2 of clp protease [Koliella corcontica]AIT94475.1 proteolytic subunit 2 of clp protease [Koliella corcontica]